MSAKEKALELYGKVYSEVSFELSDGYNSLEKHIVAKKCAIISVDLLLEELPNTLLDEQRDYKFWLEVKKEIEIL